MSRTPKVSVVVPTWNQADYLAACLDSIWFQDYPNLEIVVVADPSPDSTADVLDDYERAVGEDQVSFASDYDADSGEVRRTTHPRYSRAGRSLRIIRNAERLGHTPSYNLGFTSCTGEYCTYVASDDLLHPGMVSTLARTLAESGADFAYSDMFVVDDAGRVLRRFNLPDYSFEACFCRWYLCGVSKLYRRDLHQRFGLYDPAFVANDHECYLRFAMGGARFVHVPQVLYSVRSHEGRQGGVHARESWDRLFAESKALVLKARAFARDGDASASRP